jgi:ferredoxin
LSGRFLKGRLIMTASPEAGGFSGPKESLAARDIAQIDAELCDGCGRCLPDCAEGAIRIEGGKAVLAASLCDGLGACLESCPKGAVRIVHRPVSPFIGEAELESAAGARGESSFPSSPPAVPSGAAISYSRPCPDPCDEEEAPGPIPNWPVKLALAPVKAPFWDSEAVIWAADCAAVAGEDFRRLFIGRGIPLVIGCPKLDDRVLYETKIATLLSKNPNIKEMLLPIMSVPCCRGLWRLAEGALARSGRSGVSLKGWVFSRDGSCAQSEVPVGPTRAGLDAAGRAGEA